MTRLQKVGLFVGATVSSRFAESVKEPVELSDAARVESQKDFGVEIVKVCVDGFSDLSTPGLGQHHKSCPPIIWVDSPFDEPGVDEDGVLLVWVRVLHGRPAPARRQRVRR